MRGGGPKGGSYALARPLSSPHARGWSDLAWDCESTWCVFPACAGVVPIGSSLEQWTRSLPRMRGGGPQLGFIPTEANLSSPHARGWSLERA